MNNKNKKEDDSNRPPSLLEEMKKFKNLVDWSDGTGEYFRKSSLRKNNKPASAYKPK